MLKNKTLKSFYDITLIIFALISILLVILDFSQVLDLNSEPWFAINTILWFFFTCDYLTRLFLSDNKKKFFWNNMFDLLAILPFDTAFSVFRFGRAFRLFRLLKLVRLTRLVGFIGGLEKRSHRFVQTNGFIYLLWSSIGILLLSSTMYSFAEHVSWGESFWWAITTATTVGYGDISPHTLMGKMAAVLLMVVGIGFIGTLTSTITTYFSKGQTADYRKINKKLDIIEKQNEDIKNQLAALKKENISLKDKNKSGKL